MTGPRSKPWACLAALAVAAPLVCQAGAQSGTQNGAQNNPDLPRVPAYRPAEPNFDRIEPMPQELVDVELTEKPGAQIDLGLAFVDSSGRSVTLAEYFDGTTPVILNLTYFRCPMACPVILQALAGGLAGLDLQPGTDYRVLTVSIDPTDTVAAALKHQHQTLRTLRAAHPAADPDDWVFLVGPGETSRALADAVGYGYKYLPGPKQYSHRDVIMLLSPEGRVTRYLAGRSYPEQTLRLSLVEAAEGRIGSPVDRLRLYFCYYDTGDKKYALRASRIMTAGGAVTVLTLCIVLGLLWTREHRRNRPAQDDADAIRP